MLNLSVREVSVGEKHIPNKLTKFSHLLRVFLVTRINTFILFFHAWYTLRSSDLTFRVGTVFHPLIHLITGFHVNTMSDRIYLVIANIPDILTRSPRCYFALNKNMYFHEFRIFFKGTSPFFISG